MSARVRRAVGVVLLGVLIAVGCTLAGRWQWNRHVARDAQIAVVEANYDADPVPLSAVLDSPAQPLAATQEWQPVEVVGRYDPQRTVLLRNRPVDGQPGYHVLVPLVLEEGGEPGSVLLVDRGYIPWGDDASSAVDVPEPPAGSVTVTARLRLDEPSLGRAAPAGQVQSITVDEVLVAGGSTDPAQPAYRAYGSLVAEDPAAGALGALATPSTDPGSHLSYSFQWWTFALGSLVGFSMLARRDLRESADDDPQAAEPTAREPRRRRGPSAEDEEDALVDARLGAHGRPG